MNENAEEKLLDLLYKKAVHGLNEEEIKELEKLEMSGGTDIDAESLELTAAMLSMASLEVSEPLPANLRSRILADSERYFDETEDSRAENGAVVPVVPADTQVSGRSIWGWLGWVAAAAACVALALNIYITGVDRETVRQIPTTPTPEERLTPEQMRQRLIETAPDLARAEWQSPDVKNPDQVSGDVVWSDAEQAGYMRLRGLPVNDPGKNTYQLWIFDETQDEKTPIDGGTFDISTEGEVIIPIDARLKAKNTKLFAITVEKPGGVVVSKREKVAALAKRET